MEYDLHSLTSENIEHKATKTVKKEIKGIISSRYKQSNNIVFIANDFIRGFWICPIFYFVQTNNLRISTKNSNDPFGELFSNILYKMKLTADYFGLMTSPV